MLGASVQAAPLMQSAPGPETLIDGVRYLYFGGTSYLGLAARSEVIKAGCEAMRRFGVHTATSRSGFGNSPPVLEVERRAAEFFGTEDAFYFTSGYAANHILAAALAPPDGTVLVDEAAHYCVLEAARSSGLAVATFRHRDPEDLARQVRGKGRVLVMADAVGPATGWPAPVTEYLEALAGQERAWLLLDDAHGFGVLGDAGRGWLDELHLWPRVNRWPSGDGVNLYVAGTLAKALGGHGGILPGSREFLARARSASHYFSGASAPAAAVAGATAKALEIVSSEPELRSRLRENVGQLRGGLRRFGLNVPEGAAAQVGIRIGDAANMMRIHQELKARGILVPYFGTYSGLPPEGVLRFAVFATHTQDQIGRLLAALRSLL